MTFFMSIVGVMFIAPVTTFTIAIMQGIYFLIRYRTIYGHVPVPLLPAQGIVAKREKKNDSILQEKENQNGSTSKQLPPLKLLVIGDSLAAGVGVSRSCTPILPEAIAKALSEHLRDRTVSWTCIAEPGAPAGWIVDKLERKSSTLEKVQSFTHTTEVCSVPTIIGQEECNATEEDLEKMDSKSDYLQDFDVGIVVTGLNDLKSSFLPFLLGGKQLEFRRQAKARGGDYALELKRVILAVANKMKKGLEESIDRLKVSTGYSSRRLPEMTAGICKGVAAIDCSESTNTHSSSSSLSLLDNERTSLVVHKHDECNYQTKEICTEESLGFSPLIVLTALPRTLPVLPYPPFIWFVLPLLRYIDKTKQKVAETYEGVIVFVEPPTKAELYDYETKQSSEQTEARKTRCSLVSITNISQSEKRRIEKEMKDFYQEKNNHGSILHKQNHEQSFLCSGRSNQNYLPGSSLLSVDRIHWNDEGYEFWGDFIAKAIIKEWENNTTNPQN